VECLIYLMHQSLGKDLLEEEGYYKTKKVICTLLISIENRDLIIWLSFKLARQQRNFSN